MEDYQQNVYFEIKYLLSLSRQDTFSKPKNVARDTISFSFLLIEFANQL
jgi:hypothetical protein